MHLHAPGLDKPLVNDAYVIGLVVWFEFRWKRSSPQDKLVYSVSEITRRSLDDSEKILIRHISLPFVFQAVELLLLLIGLYLRGASKIPKKTRTR